MLSRGGLGGRTGTSLPLSAAGEKNTLSSPVVSAQLLISKLVSAVLLRAGAVVFEVSLELRPPV